MKTVIAKFYGSKHTLGFPLWVVTRTVNAARPRTPVGWRSPQVSDSTSSIKQSKRYSEALKEMELTRTSVRRVLHAFSRTLQSAEFLCSSGTDGTAAFVTTKNDRFRCLLSWCYSTYSYQLQWSAQWVQDPEAIWEQREYVAGMQRLFSEQSARNRSWVSPEVRSWAAAAWNGEVSRTAF